MYTEIKKNTETELRYGMCKKVKYICNLSVWKKEEKSTI
jgi:hypothetical protein